MHKIFMITILFLLAGCTMPETKIYSIVVPPEKGFEMARADKSVNIIMRSPRYLAQPYVAYRVSPYQLAISKYSKWESSPVDIAKNAFAGSLSQVFREVRASNYTPEDFYAVEISLKRFEMAGSGKESSGELVLTVRLNSPDGREISHETVSKSVDLGDRDNLALAKALSSALVETVNDITGRIAAAVNPR